MSMWREFKGVIRTRLLLVFLAYTFRSLTALALAWPLAQRLAPSNVMALPRADRELFAPGASVIVGVLTEQRARLLPFWRWVWLWGAALVLVGAVAASILLSGLAAPKGTRL